MAHALETDRLILREWTDADLAPFAALNADPDVAAYLPSVLTRRQSDAMAERIAVHFRQHGFGLWAVEIRGVTSFAGFVGLSVPAFEASFTPCVEVGWRLARAYWGQGFATEGARCALRYAFTSLSLLEVVSFTVADNRRSLRVMERIGMQPAGAFEHPKLPAGHRLKRHLLYRLRRESWRSG